MISIMTKSIGREDISNSNKLTKGTDDIEDDDHSNSDNLNYSNKERTGCNYSGSIT